MAHAQTIVKAKEFLTHGNLSPKAATLFSKSNEMNTARFREISAVLAVSNVPKV